MKIKEYLMGKKIEKKYRCYWCNYEFKQKIGYSNLGSKKSGGPDQVKCKNCGGFITT